MYAAAVKTKKNNESRAAAYSVAQRKRGEKQGNGFVDNRPASLTQRKLQSLASRYAGSLNARKKVNSLAANKTNLLQLKADVELIEKAPSPAMVGALGAGDWGLTIPEDIRLDFNPKLNNNQWEVDVNKIKGRFSQQVRLLPGVTEVTGPGGNSNAGNYANQVTDLRDLGDPPGAWYMLQAVQDHEDVHKSQFLPALKTRTAKMEEQFNGLTAPRHMNKTNAKLHIQNLGGFGPARTNAFNQWFNECTRRITEDHKPGGRTDSAERRVVNPMIRDINDEAVKSGWGPKV